jgi:hypothetical protein
MQFRGRQVVYAILVVAGLIATGYFNLQFVRQRGGFNLVDFVAGGFANPAASSISCDITVAFWLFWSGCRVKRGDAACVTGGFTRSSG